MLLWIIENTLAASVLAILVAVVCRFQCRRPAFCHLLWLLVLCALVMPPLPLAFAPGQQLRAAVGDWVRPASTDAVVTEAIPALGASSGAKDRLVLLKSRPVPPATPIQPELTVTRETPRLIPSLPLTTWLLLGWLVGTVLVLGRQLQRMLRFNNRLRDADAAPRALVQTVRSVARLLRTRTPRTLLVKGIGTPSVWCLGSPRLLWPAPDPQNSDFTERPLVAHELAHLARKDHWVSWLELLTLGLYWWNPLFWIIRSQIHFFAELSCDAWALWAFPTRRRAYAEALINTQLTAAAAPLSLQGLGATNTDFRHFERRLNMIMKSKLSRGVSKGAAALAILTTVLVLPGLSNDEQSKQKQWKHNAEQSTSSVEQLATARKLFQQAEKHYSSRDYSAAVKLYEQALAADPSNGLVHGRLGYSLVSEGEFEGAAQHFKRQVALGYDVPTATYNLACTAARAGEQDQALDYLSKAVRQGFYNSRLMAADSDLEPLRNRDEFKQAIADCKMGVQYKQALAAVDQKSDPKAALKAYDALARVLADKGDLLHDYGILQLKSGMYQEAAQTFQHQADVGHKPGTAYYNLACARALSGDREGAFKSLKASLKHGMTMANASEDPDLESIKEDPRFEQLKTQLAAPELFRKKVQHALESGNLEDAAKGLEAIGNDPRTNAKLKGWAHFELGQVMTQTNRMKQAIQSYQQAAEANYQADQAAARIAFALASLGQLDDARAHVQHALDLGLSDPALLKKMQHKWSLWSDEGLTEMVQHAEKAAKQKQAQQSKEDQKKKSAWNKLESY